MEIVGIIIWLALVAGVSYMTYFVGLAFKTCLYVGFQKYEKILFVPAVFVLGGWWLLVWVTAPFKVVMS